MSSNSSSGDDSSDEFEVDDEGSCDRYACLICDRLESTVESFFKHIESQHDWDVLRCIHLLPDQYAWISFVNWARSLKPKNWKDFLLLSAEERQLFLQPFLPQDEVLMIDIESLLPLSDSDKSETKDPAQLREENDALLFQLSKCRHLLADALGDGERKLTNSFEDHETIYSKSIKEEIQEKHNSFTSPCGGKLASVMALNDSVSLGAFRNFILHNGNDLFADKTILNIASGSGLLSMLLAKAGAKSVLALESSLQLAEAARKSVISNGFEDVVQVIHGRINKFQHSCLGRKPNECPEFQLGSTKVHAIVCDWMGYFLFYQSNISSLLSATEAFFSPAEWKVYPRHASLRLIPVECTHSLLHEYVDVSPYNFDLSDLQTLAYSLPYVADFSSDVHSGRLRLLSPGSGLEVLQIDLGLPSVETAFSQCSDLVIDPPNAEGTTFQLNAFVGYFDCRMDDTAKYRIEFSTSPLEKSTHYLQTIFFLRRPIAVSTGDSIKCGTHLSGVNSEDEDHLSLKLDLNHQSLPAGVSYTFNFQSYDFV